MNIKKKDPAAVVMTVLVLLFFALSGIFIYAGVSDGSSQPVNQPSSAPSITTPSESSAGETTATTLPEENVVITAACTQQHADARVEAGASVNSPGQIVSLTCSLIASDGEVLYLNTIPADQGKWEIVGQSGDCSVRVTATTATGKTEFWEQDVSFTQPEFIWPVEPEYQLLLHDRYQVSSGDDKIAGYTHNNGLQREKHYVYGGRRNHYGFDITTPESTDVHACADGTVLGIYTDTDETGSTGYGRYIIIRHSAKHSGVTVYTLYAHLSKVLVSSGDKVAQGQTVALSGNTGGSRIPHLHLEFRLGGNDQSHTVDPLQLLPERDFSLRRSSLENVEGFLSSSVALYADMLSGGWDYSIPGRTKYAATLNGSDVPVGTPVVITYRKGSTVSFTYGGAAYTCDTDDLEYTFD